MSTETTTEPGPDPVTVCPHCGRSEVPSPWMTKAEVAAYHRVGERTVDRWSTEPDARLTRFRIDDLQSVRFSRQEVEALVVPA